MTTAAASLPEALVRALPLLRVQPSEPRVERGYLDLSGDEPMPASGSIQAVWESGIGAALYDPLQAFARRLFTFARLPGSLRLPVGGRALDIGCGPGDITAALGRAAGPHGLALGMDVSVPMLERAVRDKGAANVGFLRADARQLPFRDAGFDLVTCVAVLQLIPEPRSVLAQTASVLAPGGQLALMVPTVRGGLFDRLARLLGTAGELQFFDPDQVAADLHDNGMSTVHTRRHGPALWVVARR
ncbi:class I SAM-dependent methyltransferase [Pseudonocardia acidicola]|uniref:class I SAM-dependent methyltransferase n=1 Tax=Pseudonocardia acidicola TaxID=2724939 RepID=UPI001B7CE3C5